MNTPAPGRGTIALATRIIGGCVELRVSDNGTGIREEVRDRLFEPFFTPKPIVRLPRAASGVRPILEGNAA